MNVMTFKGKDNDLSSKKIVHIQWFQLKTMVNEHVTVCYFNGQGI